MATKRTNLMGNMLRETVLCTSSVLPSLPSTVFTHAVVSSSQKHELEIMHVCKPLTQHETCSVKVTVNWQLVDFLLIYPPLPGNWQQDSNLTHISRHKNVIIWATAIFASFWIGGLCSQLGSPRGLSSCASLSSSSVTARNHKCNSPVKGIYNQ